MRGYWWSPWGETTPYHIWEDHWLDSYGRSQHYNGSSWSCWLYGCSRGGCGSWKHWQLTGCQAESMKLGCHHLISCFWHCDNWCFHWCHAVGGRANHVIHLVGHQNCHCLIWPSTFEFWFLQWFQWLHTHEHSWWQVSDNHQPHAQFPCNSGL